MVGLPWWHSGWESTCQCRGHRFDPCLVQEDPTCHGATKPVRHNCWACALEPTCHNYWSPCTWSPCSATREATAMRGPHTAARSSPCSPQLEKAHTQQQRSNADKNKQIKWIKKKKKSNGSLKAKLHYTHSKQILFLILPCVCRGTCTHRDTNSLSM